MHALNNKVSKKKGKTWQFEGRNKQFISIGWDRQYPTFNKTTKQINKCIEELNSAVNQLNLTAIIEHFTQQKHNTHFSQAHMDHSQR